MQFSLRVICNRSITETVKQRVAALTDYLSLSEPYGFSPYWKDEACAVLEIHARIENPDHREIQRYIRLISGTDHISECGPLDDWECAYYAPLDTLHTDRNAVFVVCNIFEGQGVV